jgi:hypothetical protein
MARMTDEQREALAEYFAREDRQNRRKELQDQMEPQDFDIGE